VLRHELAELLLEGLYFGGMIEIHEVSSLSSKCG
jgi:hypothetical protein